MTTKINIHDVKNVTITEPHYFPASESRREPFYTQELVIRSEDGSEMRVTLFTHHLPATFFGVDHATQRHWSGIA